MSTRILDTNIVSYLMRGGALARAYQPHVLDHLLAISFITGGELYFGAEKGNWGQSRRNVLEAIHRNFVIIPTTMRLLAATVDWSPSGSEPEDRLLPTMPGLPPALCGTQCL